MTTYYVDAAAGADTNNGTSEATPWRTLPGTRNVGNTAFLRTSWGSVTSSAKIQPGDVINLKAGTSHTSANGGKIFIEPTFYNNGTLGSPIVIQVSSTWGSGNFTVNGTGITVDTFWGLVSINNLGNIQFKGADATRRIHITNANATWTILVQGNSTTHKTGFVADYMEVSAGNSYGFDISYCDQFTVSHLIAHDFPGASIGISCGQLGDANCDNGSFIDCEAYNIGLSAPNQALAQGYQLSGCTNITFLRCISHNNGRDGFDNGSASSANDKSFSATYINCDSYDNGEDGFGCNAGPSTTHKITLINCIMFNCGQGGLTAYDGVNVEMYHCVLHFNNSNPGNGGQIFVFRSGTSFASPTVKLRNCIVYKSHFLGSVGTFNIAAPIPSLDTDYNIYVPRTSNTEQFVELPPGTTWSYNSPPPWIGVHDKRSLASDPGFIATSTVSFAANDYRISLGTSPAIGAGILVTTPAEALIDRNGVTRSNPPTIGLFEFSTTGLRAYTGSGKIQVSGTGVRVKEKSVNSFGFVRILGSASKAHGRIAGQSISPIRITGTAGSTTASVNQRTYNGSGLIFLSGNIVAVKGHSFSGSGKTTLSGIGITSYFHPLLKRSIVIINGDYKELPIGLENTGLAPLVYLADGTIQARLTNEGVPIIIVNGEFYTLAPDEPFVN